jgi:hypothetical protein
VQALFACFSDPARNKPEPTWLFCPTSDNAFPVLTATRRRSLFFNWVPAIDRNNLPSQRMSIFPDHVLQRFPEPELQNMLTAPGYI